MAQTEEKFDTDAAAQTGIGPTLMVAIEQKFSSEQRIIQDNLAVKILPGGYRFFVKPMQIPVLRNWMARIQSMQLLIWEQVMTPAPIDCPL